MSDIVLISPEGNREVWPREKEAARRARGYVSPEEWAAAHPAARPEREPYQPTAEDVKAEAARRISATMPDWMVAREVSDGDPIPQAVKDYAAAVRKASDALEAVEPIPPDYTDDRWWPSPVEKALAC